MPLRLAAAVGPGQPAQLPPGLVRDGDRWVCLGDSITAANCYAPQLERVLKHFHPGASFSVINSGQNGDTASPDLAKLEARVLRHRPNVVSIMYGMNEAINYWKPDKPREPIQQRYRAALTTLVRELKGRGITVLLMSPTVTDPTTHYYFTLDRTVPFLHECATIVREVATQEGAIYVPVQEESEALAQALPPGVTLTSDGVHPAALGQYAIASALWRAAGMDRPLRGATATATVTDPAKSVATTTAPCSLELPAKFAGVDARTLDMAIVSPRAGTVQVRWSLGEVRGETRMEVAAGSTPWRLELPEAAWPRRNGQNNTLLLDIALSGEPGRSLYFLDMCRTGVLHFQDGRVSGTVEAEEPRAEGKVLANWQARPHEDGLWLSFEVFDRDLVTNGVFPFSRDGLNLMLDFRPTARFAAIGVDREVTQTFLNVREQPFFGVGLRAWTGQGMDFASTVGGEKTPTGYKVEMLIRDNFNLHSPVKLSQRDFVGLLVAVAYHDGPETPQKLRIVTGQKNDGPVSLYANNLLILDLKNKLPGDAVVNLHLTSATAPVDLARATP